LFKFAAFHGRGQNEKLFANFHITYDGAGRVDLHTLADDGNFFAKGGERVQRHVGNSGLSGLRSRGGGL
ncbi:hypothetical protein, partial [Stenotrophomonas maltophilia group sp. Smal32]|uniref:hypothetical protein n=1 Tax=Stenotrophomonas maltophilia group sp. Smal32 TaxID=3377164 RepID=UPI00255666C5